MYSEASLLYATLRLNNSMLLLERGCVRDYAPVATRPRAGAINATVTGDGSQERHVYLCFPILFMGPFWWTTNIAGLPIFGWYI